MNPGKSKSSDKKTGTEKVMCVEVIGIPYTQDEKLLPGYSENWSINGNSQFLHIPN